MDSCWTHVGSCGTHVDSCWTHVDSYWTHVGLMWAHVELMWTHVGLMWTHVGLMWAHVELMWTHVGLMWTHVVGLMWTHVELMWTHVELTWTHVELMWTHVELMWTHVDLMWSSCGLRWDDYFRPLALSPSSSSWARLPKPGRGPTARSGAEAGGPAKPRWCPTDTRLNWRVISNRQPPMKLRAGRGPGSRPVNGAAPTPQILIGAGAPSWKLCPFFSRPPNPSSASSPSSLSSRISPGPEGRGRA